MSDSKKSHRMQVLITTNDQYIEGELILPENMRFSSFTPNNMLFYILNGGFQFLTLKNCEIQDRKNLAFRPDKCSRLHVNISSVITIQILEILPQTSNTEDDDDENIVGYNKKNGNTKSNKNI